ncbi:hypothetical protein SeLEV6574_g01408 [Synchytrium endobioticum]|uniref:Uncharacterized protein n=1 Tax=Synchytrium endobioticum TaxID=286115 RepID=A0A507DDV4_9FUNG|nr:hypothetical protein SeLEV6574_g01408 [Synchytrium endobioticum]
MGDNHWTMNTKVERHVENQYSPLRWATALVNAVQIGVVAVSIYFSTNRDGYYYSFVQVLELVCPVMCVVALCRFDMENKDRKAFLWVECSRIFVMYTIFNVASAAVNVFLILLRWRLVSLSVPDVTANQVLYGTASGTYDGVAFSTILKITPCVMVGADLLGFSLGVFWHRKSLTRLIPCK